MAEDVNSEESRKKLEEAREQLEGDFSDEYVDDGMDIDYEAANESFDNPRQIAQDTQKPEPKREEGELDEEYKTVGTDAAKLNDNIVRDSAEALHMQSQEQEQSGTINSSGHNKLQKGSSRSKASKHSRNSKKMDDFYDDIDETF